MKSDESKIFEKQALKKSPCASRGTGSSERPCPKRPSPLGAAVRARQVRFMVKKGVLHGNDAPIAHDPPPHFQFFTYIKRNDFLTPARRPPTSAGGFKAVGLKLLAVRQTRVLSQHQIRLSRFLLQFQDQTNLKAVANRIPNDTRATLPALRLSSRVHELTNHHQKARLEWLVQCRTKFQARVGFCIAKLNSFSCSQYRTQLEVLA